MTILFIWSVNSKNSRTGEEGDREPGEDGGLGGVSGGEEFLQVLSGFGGTSSCWFWCLSRLKLPSAGD